MSLHKKLATFWRESSRPGSRPMISLNNYTFEWNGAALFREGINQWRWVPLFLIQSYWQYNNSFMTTLSRFWLCLKLGKPEKPRFSEAGKVIGSSNVLEIYNMAVRKRASKGGSSKDHPKLVKNTKPKSRWNGFFSRLNYWSHLKTTYDEMPDHLQFNEYIRKGYRKITDWKGCIFSLLFIHNETANIITHGKCNSI